MCSILLVQVDVVEESLGDLEHRVHVLDLARVALVGHVDQRHLERDDVLWRHVSLAAADDVGDLLREDVEEPDVGGDAAAARVGGVPLREEGEAVDEGDDDVLDVDHRVQLPARRQEVVQGRQVHLVGENLTKEKGPFEWIGGFLPIKF